MGHQGDLAHRDDRPEAFPDHAQQQRAADHSGIEGIVRLGAVPDDGIDGIDHPLCDVGVVVEAEQDRHVGSEDLAAEVGLLALDVVEANGRAGAVKLEVQAVEPAGVLQALADDIQEVGAEFIVDASSGHGMSANDGNRLDLDPGIRHCLQVTAHLSLAARLGDDVRSQVQAERPVVAHIRQLGIEVVCFLGDVDQSNAHRLAPRRTFSRRRSPCRRRR